MYDFNGLNALADISRQQARSRGNSPAFFFEGRETTFSAFDKHTSQVANGLIALGQKPHARIGYMGMNSDRYFEVLLARQGEYGRRRHQLAPGPKSSTC
jgi:acyl-CoA synthetase (AMP-forming)/AMP-acid ligase II